MGVVHCAPRSTVPHLPLNYFIETIIELVYLIELKRKRELVVVVFLEIQVAACNEAVWEINK